jgi:hypothetical protein
LAVDRPPTLLPSLACLLSSHSSPSLHSDKTFFQFTEASESPLLVIDFNNPPNLTQSLSRCTARPKPLTDTSTVLWSIGRSIIVAELKDDVGTAALTCTYTLLPSKKLNYAVTIKTYEHMAISPRRSSRSARTSQPGSLTQQHTQSSASSVSSGRPDRNARSHQKIASPRPSMPTRSESADDLEDLERPHKRRTRGIQEDQKDDPSIAVEDEVDEEAEEEVTRCICGNQEYPGLPTANPDLAKKSDPNSTGSEDSTGWFIQCDNCKVWQHGGCVGIMDESTSPDEYFCEQCRKDLHKIMTTPTGYVKVL